MINPSINGWIDKYFIELKSKDKVQINNDLFYNNLRETGFLFGNILEENNQHKLLKSELFKVSFLNALYGIFSLNNSIETDFIEKCNSFFEIINPNEHTILDKLLPKNSPSLNLEKKIEERINSNENVISKNFSHLVTNAFLFVDVLAFQQYIIHGIIPEKYLKRIEETIISIITLALKTKSNKSKHDDLLIKLFESSTRYSKFSEVNISNLESLNLGFFKNDFEKKYFIDLASLTLWSDGEIENNEIYFLHKLNEILSLPDEFVDESLNKINNFIIKNKKQLPYFNDSNPVKSFYDQTSQNVMTLIVRNKKRLTKEINQSKELMRLLAVSTSRNLDDAEKKKVKKQLLDICKTIPSLTIFLIPGGSLLLPLLIKFIPQLLPSSFNENLED
ncbi:MAG: hypothetical protein H7174_02680 [Flavobacterium sp.]|nr:hypothetical protein [Flavobacterium sp.]